MSQTFANEKQDYAFEQILHARLRSYTVEDELEVYAIKLADLNRVWANELIKAAPSIVNQKQTPDVGR